MDKNSIPFTIRIKMLAQTPSSSLTAVVSAAAQNIADAAHGIKMDSSQFASALSHMLAARVALDTALRLGFSGGPQPGGPAMLTRITLLGESPLTDETVFALEADTKEFLKTMCTQMAALGNHIRLNPGNADVGRLIAALDTLLLASHTFASAAVLGAALQQKRQRNDGDESASTSPERIKTRRTSEITSQ